MASYMIGRVKLFGHTFGRAWTCLDAFGRVETQLDVFGRDFRSLPIVSPTTHKNLNYRPTDLTVSEHRLVILQYVLCRLFSCRETTSLL